MLFLPTDEMMTVPNPYCPFCGAYDLECDSRNEPHAPSCPFHPDRVRAYEDMLTRDELLRTGER